MGEPTDEDSYYGQWLDLRDELHEQVQKQYNKEDVWFENNPEVKGAYYPASILVDLNLEAFDNELFGPVASVIRAKMMPML
jgi:succinate-semialdehyde dehydrogenase/glutarate-semialdehyde dehydrogenase